MAKLLLVGEGVTLAHVARPLVVGKVLAEAGHEVAFACDKRFLPLIDLAGMRHIPIHSLDSGEFLKRVSVGKPLFTAAEMKAMVEEDRRILKELRPALVIGDLRWSLGISARLESIPYAAISNAHWSPYALHQQWVLPDHPTFRHLGFAGMQRVFHLLRPIKFLQLTIPTNRLRRRYGLPSLGWDYRKLHEDADIVLFADAKALSPTRDLPPTHHYIEPIHWSPAIPLPAWWDRLRDDRPIIYVNLGSSGGVHLLPMILQVLAQLPVQVMAATAGRLQLDSPAPHIFIADYLPGEACAGRAALVINNGGSISSYQSLAQGAPILGIVSLMDQHLSIQAVAKAGAGTLLCAPYVTPAVLRSSIEQMLADASFKQNAARLQHSCRSDPARLAGLIESLLAKASL